MSASLATVCLDMNICKRPRDDQRQMRIQIETLAITMIFSFIESGTLSARWSFMLDYENSLDPVLDRRAFVQDVSLHCAEIVEPDESIRELALQLVDTQQVQARDALHLACAEQSGCDYLLTCDDRLVKQGNKLRESGVLTVQVLNPVDFVQEV